MLEMNANSFQDFCFYFSSEFVEFVRVRGTDRDKELFMGVQCAFTILVKVCNICLNTVGMHLILPIQCENPPVPVILC